MAISSSPLSSTSPICTKIVVPPVHRCFPSLLKTPASSRASCALSKSPCKSPNYGRRILTTLELNSQSRLFSGAFLPQLVVTLCPISSAPLKSSARYCYTIHHTTGSPTTIVQAGHGKKISATFQEELGSDPNTTSNSASAPAIQPTLQLRLRPNYFLLEATRSSSPSARSRQPRATGRRRDG